MNRLLTGILILALGTGTAVAGQTTDTTGQHAHDPHRDGRGTGGCRRAADRG